MAIQELQVFPQVTLSEGQGLVGVRKWVLDQTDDLGKFLNIVAKSRWPGFPGQTDDFMDCIPYQIQSGAYFDGVCVGTRSVADRRTEENIGPLPVYGKTLVVAQYALHKMTNCWPETIPKPYHPEGTTLSLRIRGAGQYLLVSPAGVQAASPLMTCTPGAAGLGASVGTRVIVPIAEYHIACDRMTKTQVDDALRVPTQVDTTVNYWDMLLGCVHGGENPNSDFLGAEAETLLFDGYELTETFCCDILDPVRYCLTAVFKKRVLVNEGGTTMVDDDGLVVGWNHDYVNKIVSGKPSKTWGWLYIQMTQNGVCVPRYTPVDFSGLFGPYAVQPCGASVVSDTITYLDDADICK